MPPYENRIMKLMGGLNLVSTTTKQTGRPRETDHPSQIKYNVFCKSLSPFNAATHIWQQVTAHIHTLPEHWVSAVPGSQTMPEEWEENTVQLLEQRVGHMIAPTSPPLFPAFFPPLLSKCQESLLLLLPRKLSTIPNTEKCDLQFP